MDRVRVGVVGVGSMGRTYAEAIGAIEGLELAMLLPGLLGRTVELPIDDALMERALRWLVAGERPA